MRGSFIIDVGIASSIPLQKVQNEAIVTSEASLFSGGGLFRSMCVPEPPTHQIFPSFPAVSSHPGDIDTTVLDLSIGRPPGSEYMVHYAREPKPLQQPRRFRWKLAVGP